MDAQSETKMGDVAVLISCYNDESRLKKSLLSLDAAKGKFDIYIVDDGSRPAVSFMGFQLEHKKFKLLRLDVNGGISRALNYGLNNIFRKGYQYIARLDCGDTVHELRFIRQVETFENHRTLGIVGSWVVFQGEGGPVSMLELPTQPELARKSLHRRAVLIHPAVMFSRTALEECGVYDSNYEPAEDYELFLRISKHFEVANIPEFLTFCEIRESGISVKKRKIQLYKKLIIQLKYFDATIESWLGILISLVGLCLPYSLVRRLNKTSFGGWLQFRRPNGQMTSIDAIRKSV